MQLFGLVNTLLAKDSETFQRHLTIQKYSVVPLSPNSGLIGWVDNTDTLHVLIRNYRDSRKILLNIEHRLMLQVRACSFATAPRAMIDLHPSPSDGAAIRATHFDTEAGSFRICARQHRRSGPVSHSVA
jgi:hypothetical protein